MEYVSNRRAHVTYAFLYLFFLVGFTWRERAQGPFDQSHLLFAKKEDPLTEQPTKTTKPEEETTEKKKEKKDQPALSATTHTMHHLPHTTTIKLRKSRMMMS